MENGDRSKMILLINICKEKLHYFEFVKPVETILSKNKIEYLTKHYKEINISDLKNSDKIIICGTSLKDNDFLISNKFEWISLYSKPLLGICGGMEIIGKVFEGKIKEKKEIGFNEINFEIPFLGSYGKKFVYHLHNFYLDPSTIKDFEIFSKSYFNIPQAIKHKSKKIYGVLFHPEVRNENLIIEFCKLN